MALITMTAAPADNSDTAVRVAVREALERAEQGAGAMGLPRVELRAVGRLDARRVLIQVVAPDEEPKEEAIETVRLMLP